MIEKTLPARSESAPAGLGRDDREQQNDDIDHHIKFTHDGDDSSEEGDAEVVQGSLKMMSITEEDEKATVVQGSIKMVAITEDVEGS